MNIKNTPSLGQYIKEHRVKLQFSEYQLAFLLGCTHQTVIDWESDISRPPMIFWEKLIKTLGMNKRTFIEKNVTFDNLKYKKNLT